MTEPQMIFPFIAENGRRSRCGIDVHPLDDGRVVVICTELPDNPGMSITNAVEQIATAVVRGQRIIPERLVWIEHWPAASRGGGPSTWDLVTFKLSQRSIWEFRYPSWRPMTPLDWAELDLKPME